MADVVVMPVVRYVDDCMLYAVGLRKQLRIVQGILRNTLTRMQTRSYYSFDNRSLPSKVCLRRS
jgi:hypothetical protein